MENGLLRACFISLQTYNPIQILFATYAIIFARICYIICISYVNSGKAAACKETLGLIG